MGDTYSNTTPSIRLDGDVSHHELESCGFCSVKKKRKGRKIVKKKKKKIEIRIMIVILLEKGILNFKTKRWQKIKLFQRLVKLYFYCEKWSKCIIYTFSNLQVTN